MIIASYHIDYIFHTGWIFVEFFFMISGYFAFKHYISGKEVAEPEHFPVIYAVKKLLKILPYSSIAIILMFLKQTIEHNLSFREGARFAIYTLENLFLINGTGVIPKEFPISDNFTATYMPIGSLWYLTVLIVAIPIMLYLVRGTYKKLGLGLVGLLPFMIYGYIIMHDGSINGWHEGMGFYFTLCMRGLAGLLLGGLIYYISDKIRAGKKEGAGAAGLFIVEVLSFAGVALIATLTVSSYEVLFIILLIISLSITFSGVTVSAKMHGAAFTFLGKLSLPIYCIHPVVRAFVGDENIGMFFLLTIAASIVMVVVVEGIGKIFKHNG